MILKYYPVSAHDMDQYNKREEQHKKDVEEYKSSKKIDEKLDNISIRKIKKEILEGSL